MHRAESVHVALGRKHNWPAVIDWGNVRLRLENPFVVAALQDIISDPHKSSFFTALYDTIKRDGILKASSIKGQLDNFELSHPG